MNYLDDFFLLGDNFEEYLKTVENATDLLSKLGFQINLGKSVFIPAQGMEHLGFLLDSKIMIVILTLREQEKLTLFIKKIMSSNKVKETLPTFLECFRLPYALLLVIGGFICSFWKD